MFNFFYNIFWLASTSQSLDSTTQGGNATLDPIYNMLSILLPSAMGIIFAIGSIYGIVLGVQYAKAPDAGDREKCKKRLISMVTGVVVVLALLGLLFAIRGTLTDLIS